MRWEKISEEDLETLRRRRLRELQQKLAQEQQQINVQEELNRQKQAVLRQILTTDARQRLTNLKIVKPEFAEQLEMQLIQLAQQNRIRLPITDKQLKEILIKLQSRRKEIKIRRVG